MVSSKSTQAHRWRNTYCLFKSPPFDEPYGTFWIRLNLYGVRVRGKSSKPLRRRLFSHASFGDSRLSDNSCTKSFFVVTFFLSPTTQSILYLVLLVSGCGVSCAGGQGQGRGSLEGGRCRRSDRLVLQGEFDRCSANFSTFRPHRCLFLRERVGGGRLLSCRLCRSQVLEAKTVCCPQQQSASKILRTPHGSASAWAGTLTLPTRTTVLASYR